MQSSISSHFLPSFSHDSIPTLHLVRNSLIHIIFHMFSLLIFILPGLHSSIPFSYKSPHSCNLPHLLSCYLPFTQDSITPFPLVNDPFIDIILHTFFLPSFIFPRLHSTIPFSYKSPHSCNRSHLLSSYPSFLPGFIITPFPLFTNSLVHVIFHVLSLPTLILLGFHSNIPSSYKSPYSRNLQHFLFSYPHSPRTPFCHCLQLQIPSYT